MIRLLNVYYPTRTVMLLLCEAIIVSSCFLAATMLSMGPDGWLCLEYEFGFLKIAALTFVSLIFSYYFDLFEPQLVSAREAIYFRILLVLGFDCFVVSGILYFFPDAAIGTGHVYALGLAILTPVLILWRRAYDWIVSRKAFRERVYVLGAGEFARSIVETIGHRTDLGMEVIDWRDIDLPTRRAQEGLDSGTGEGSAPPRAPSTASSSPWKSSAVSCPSRSCSTCASRASTSKTWARCANGSPARSSWTGCGLQQLPLRRRLSPEAVAAVYAAGGFDACRGHWPAAVLTVLSRSWCWRCGSRLKGRSSSSRRVWARAASEFKVVKFRTMFTDAEAGGAKWATKNDPRVTKVGMFMRKTRIDEVPQLWNVLRGDMGFVGPRPERPEFVPMLSEHLPFYYLRHLIRPGLTGWAQVRYGYGATLAEAREKLEYDLYYIKHMSLGLDLLIMFETIKTILRRRGAQ